ncbi:MAG TPA: sulfatase-like hydrolase/transferase [Planctomycetota bacterium]|nr:sulfatase-like hydrolase/transferase [Planctomycetota bacterium]
MKQPRRPNLLFIMADQWRHDYLGCAGHKTITTPHIDSLAARGVRFTHCCTNSPICAPARIALACGLQPSRVGALDNACALPPNVPTYYQRLRDTGYRVASCGKLDLNKPEHFNGRNGDRPDNYRWGFTDPFECEGKMHAGSFPTPHGPYGFWLQERGLYDAFHADYRRRGGDFVRAMEDSVLPTDAFEDCFIADYAARWIRDVNEEYPWHLFVSFVGPHDPFDPPTEYANLYRNRAMPALVEPALEHKPRRIHARFHDLTPEERLTAQRQYCASSHAIDIGVGKILAALQARGGLDNTYIVFSSDHGEMLGDLGLYTKHVPYEAALRVPLIVAGPSVEKSAAGTTNDALVELIDLNATLCDFAGLPAQERIDAKSIAPLVRGETKTHRDEVISIERPYRLLRTHRWKFIETYNDTNELYDLEKDPGERHNVVKDFPAEAKAFKKRLEARML